MKSLRLINVLRLVKSKLSKNYFHTYSLYCDNKISTQKYNKSDQKVNDDLNLKYSLQSSIHSSNFSHISKRHKNTQREKVDNLNNR